MNIEKAPCKHIVHQCRSWGMVSKWKKYTKSLEHTWTFQINVVSCTWDFETNKTWAYHWNIYLLWHHLLKVIYIPSNYTVIIYRFSWFLMVFNLCRSKIYSFYQVLQPELYEINFHFKVLNLFLIKLVSHTLDKRKAWYSFQIVTTLIDGRIYIQVRDTAIGWCFFREMLFPFYFVPMCFP